MSGKQYFFVTACRTGKAIDGNEHILYEDDMLVSKAQKHYLDGLKNGVQKRAAVVNRFLWPRGIVYYEYDANLGKMEEEEEVYYKLHKLNYRRLL